MKQQLKTLWYILPIIVFSAMVGCTVPIEPEVTFSQPKIYSDSYVMRVLSERRQNIRVIGNQIKASELQEVTGVRQGVQIDSQTTAQPSVTGTPVHAPNPVGSNLVLPSAPTPPTQGLGRLYSEIVRDHVIQDEDLSAWEALHDLDTQALMRGKQLALIRIDVSINNFPRSKSNTPHFVRTDFELKCGTWKPLEGASEAATDKGKWEPTEDCTIYYLAPEKAVVVAQESLASTFLENYAAQLAAAGRGVDVTEAGRFQRQLEETLMTQVERPIEYAIYVDKNRFAFAFGPHRRVDRRALLNPQRWFGNTYEYGYEISPGSRDVYALVVAPCENTDIIINASWNRSLLDEDTIGRSTATNSTTIGPYIIPDSCPHSTQYSIEPQEIYPKLTNTLYITSPHPFLPRSEIIVGSEHVQEEDITRIDRYRLKVTLKPSAALQAALKSSKSESQSVKVILIPPFVVTTKDNKSAYEYDLGTITIKDSDPPAPSKPTLALKPDSAKAREEVTITVSDPQVLDMTTVQSVTFGGTGITKFVKQTKDQIILTVPDLNNNSAPTVVIRLTVNGKMNDQELKFTYLK